MEFHFTTKLEEYYQKFVELQEKLKKSEEQRFMLEMKFNDMVQVAKEEEQTHYRKLRAQYKRFLEEDKKRQDRNERIIRNLERIETRIAMLSAKTERINILRRQYQNFLLRIVKPNLERKLPDSRISRERSFIKEEPLKERQNALFRDDFSLSQRPKETLDLKKPLFEFPTEKKAVEKDQSNEEKIEILDRYLQSISSQRCRDLLNREREAKEKLGLGTRSKDDYPATNHATAIADDIMNSIYSRYYNKTDSLSKDNKLSAGKGLQDGLVRKSDEFTSTLLKSDTISKPSVSFKDTGDAVENPTYDSHENYKNVDKHDELTDGRNQQNNVPQNVSILKDDLTKSEKKVEQYIPDIETTKQKEKVLNNYEEVINSLLSVEKASKQDVEPKSDNKIITNSGVIVTEQAANDSYFHTQDFDPNSVTHSQLKQESQVQDGPYNAAEYSQQYYVDDQNYEQQPSTEYHQQSYVTNQPKEVDQNIRDYEPTQLKSEVDSPHQQNEEYINQYDSNSQEHVQYYDQNGESLLQYDQNVQPVQYQQELHDHQIQEIDYSDHHERKDQVFDADNQDKILEQYHRDKPYNEQSSYVQSPAPQAENGVEPNQYAEIAQHDQNEPLYARQTEFDESSHNTVQNQELSNIQAQHYQENDSAYNHQVELNQTSHPYDNNAVLQQHYDQTGEPLQYDQADPSYQQQYDENGQPIQYEQHSGYDQYGQPLLYDQHGQIVQPQYDEHGQIIPQYDENGQLIMLYDQSGQQYVGDQYKTDLQQYDESGQPVVQYDANGQVIYDQNQHGYDYGNQNQEEYDPSQFAQYQDGDQGHYVEPEKEIDEHEVERDDKHKESEEKDDKEKANVELVKNEEKEEKKEPKKVMDILDTDTESSKQNTSKVSNDTDFDFS